MGSILLGAENPGAGGWLWEQEAQKVAAALALMFFPLSSSVGTSCTEQCSSCLPSPSASFNPRVSRCATVSSYSTSNRRILACYRARTQPCAAKAFKISCICSLPQTSECSLKPVLCLKSLIPFPCPHGGGCRTGFQCSSEHHGPGQLLGLGPHVAVLAGLGKWR